MKKYSLKHALKPGFTLVEMAVVLALAAAVTLVSVPAVTHWLPNYRLKQAARDLYSQLQKAKVEAVKRNQTCAVTFNQVVDGERYDYVVFVDINGNLEFDTDPTGAFDGDLRFDGIDNDGDGMIDESAENGVDDDGDGLVDEEDEEADEVERVLGRVRFAKYKNDVDFDLTQGGGDGITFGANAGGLPVIGFRPNGLPRNDAGGLGMGTVHLVNTGSETIRVVLSSAGRIEIRR